MTDLNDPFVQKQRATIVAYRAELERAQETIADLLKALKAAEEKAWDHAEGLLERARQAGVEGRDEDDRNLVGRSAPFMSIYNILHPAISRATTGTGA